MASRHRKLRLHYAVGNDLNLWWCRNLRKWVTMEQIDQFHEQKLPYGFCSSRSFHRKYKAMNHAVAMGNGFQVTQFDPHCGHRRKEGSGTWLIREWFVNKPE
jgi:hypothetical protein